MKEVKLLTLTLDMVMLVSSAAIIGALVGLALSFANLSHLVPLASSITGGVISATYPFLVKLVQMRKK
ncbi:hypothetical protein [Wolbachia endosymbiont of Ctenocephalides felis wCfeT]|uniref:hypothetical protein n=1 Tax=Wolbachia endosymbiont of Ctenocephalides felis wCfeT TaxID=2732593 RepID=UPI001445C2E5|nr:hypothetical protein [Wolbachia endosymbiont of Ctenocephalides felis wCfeT]